MWKMCPLYKVRNKGIVDIFEFLLTEDCGEHFGVGDECGTPTIEQEEGCLKYMAIQMEGETVFLILYYCRL